MGAEYTLVISICLYSSTHHEWSQGRFAMFLYDQTEVTYLFNIFPSNADSSFHNKWVPLKHLGTENSKLLI